MNADAAGALRRTHAWFERNSGWAPPDAGTLAEWLADGVCRAPDDCMVAPESSCPHGLASWWLVLRSLDRADEPDPIPPDRMVPHQDRLDPRRSDYVLVIDAHHQAVLAGAAGYADPATGYHVMTARTLWARGACCEQGCRHCPYVDRTDESK
jgi:Family of unknown function (DUF5522)